MESPRFENQSDCESYIVDIEAENKSLKAENKRLKDMLSAAPITYPNPVSVEDLGDIKRMCDIILNNNLGDKELDSLALLVAHHPAILNDKGQDNG
jgi:hypothetical protein